MTDDDLSGVLDLVELYLLGEEPSLTRVQVAEQAGVPLAVAVGLWRQLGFAQVTDDDVAFTPADVEALRQTTRLVDLGILDSDRQAALVRTWGRSFARLAEWETSLLADVALEADDPVSRMVELAEEVLPRVEALQTYIWRRHLASAASRTLAGETGTTAPLAVGFVDIVGFTSRSKALTETELVGWLEEFEDSCSGIVVDHGGRVIKNIGDEVLFVADEPATAAAIALEMVERGADEDDAFPSVRGGVAYGEVVSRLGDVFGPTVNIAARLTSVARPGTVLVDRGAHEELHDDPAYAFRHLRRTPVKGYSKLQPYVIRRASART